MEITLEKIELVKDRTGVSYKEAKDALEQADGSVVDAIISIEEKIDADKENSGNFKAYSVSIADSIKELIRKGNVARIVVKKEDSVIMNLPINAGIVGALIAPWGIVAGIAAVLGFKCLVDVIKEDGEVIDVSTLAKGKMDAVTEKGIEAAETAKEKGEEYYKVAKEKGEEYYKVAKEKGKDYYEKIREKSEEAFFTAKDKANDAVDRAKEIKNGMGEEIDLSEDFDEEKDTL